MLDLSFLGVDRSDRFSPSLNGVLAAQYHDLRLATCHQADQVLVIRLVSSVLIDLLSYVLAQLLRLFLGYNEAKLLDLLFDLFL